MAKFKLLDKAYMPLMPGMPHTLLETGTEIDYDGKPGPHMAPLDDDARALFALHDAGNMELDFTRRLPVHVDTEQAEQIAVVAAAVRQVLAEERAAAAPPPLVAAPPPPPPPAPRTAATPPPPPPPKAG